MENATLDYVIIALAALTVGSASWWIIEYARSRHTAENADSIFNRVPPIRECARYLGLPAPLVALFGALSLLGVFVVLSLLQGTTFAFWSCVALLVAFMLSTRLFARLYFTKYVRTFENQLPTVIDQLVAQMRGSKTLASGLNSLPEVLPEPAAAEFFEISDRAQRGLGLNSALIAAAQKYKSRNYLLLLAVLRIFTKQGGNVINPLQRMSVAYKDLIKSDESIRTASTQGRTIFWVINGAIFFIFSFVSLAQPSMISDIFANIVGILFFVIGVIVYSSGAFWLWNMMKVDI